MRFSASSRYFAQRRARATPSSNTFSELSRGRSPDSSWSTICSSRPSASSNLMSLIPFPHLGDAGAEGALMEENLERITHPGLGGAQHDLARSQARHAIAAGEDAQGREALEAAHGLREARPRRLDTAAGRRGETDAELGQERRGAGNSSQRVARAQGAGGEGDAVADVTLARPEAQAEAALQVIQAPVEIAEGTGGIGEHAPAKEKVHALPPRADLRGHGLLQARVEIGERLDYRQLLADEQLGGHRWRGRAQIGHEIGDGEIGLVSHRGDDGHPARREGTGHTLVVEGPQVLDGTAPAPHDDDVEVRDLLQM